MVCAINKIDSNVTGLAFAEEDCLKQLPVTPLWYALEPNSYSDFGGDLSTVARAPIDPSRQNSKGTITDLDASGGFNTDLTQTNMTRLLQGFFFADARQKPSTKPINGAQIAAGAVAGTAKTYAAAAGLTIFKVGHLVLAKNFGLSANNGLKTVTTVATGLLTVAEVLADESTPPATASVHAVGFQFPAGDASVAVAGGGMILNFAATNPTTLGLNPGEWIFVGGDATANQFANNVPGYCRVLSVGATSIVFDLVDNTPTVDAGTGKTLRIFFGTVIRNESDPTLIKRRSYSLERQLGSDANGIQSEYLEGAVPNEMTLNMKTADKLDMDLTFVALDNTHRSGTQGIKTGTRNAAPGEAAFNTSSDIEKYRMYVLDATTTMPLPLFAHVTEATIKIANNVSPNKAIGTLGGIDTTQGNFEVTGSATAYFTTNDAVAAVRNNSDVGLTIGVAAHNAGIIFDIPLLGLGGGRLAVEKDNPITVPLDINGAKSKFGYTLMAAFYAYLPQVAMPI